MLNINLIHFHFKMLLNSCDLENDLSTKKSVSYTLYLTLTGPWLEFKTE